MVSVIVIRKRIKQCCLNRMRNDTVSGIGSGDFGDGSGDFGVVGSGGNAK